MITESNGSPAPLQPSGKASIPLPPFPAFADLVALIEAHISNARVPVAMIENDHLRDLLACIREQQAALVALCGPTPAGMQPETTRWETARAVLAKWWIE